MRRWKPDKDEQGWSSVWLRAEDTSPGPPHCLHPHPPLRPAGVGDGSLRAFLGNARAAQTACLEGWVWSEGWDGKVAKVEGPRWGGAGEKVSGPRPGTKRLEGSQLSPSRSVSGRCQMEWREHCMGSQAGSQGASALRLALSQPPIPCGHLGYDHA